MSSAESKNDAIMITGGSGFIGQRVVKALSENQRQVVSIYRHRLPDPSPQVYPVCSDLSNEELLAAPLRGVESVIHLAWDRNHQKKNSPSIPSKIDATSKNIKHLKTLLSAMEKAGTKRIIFLSSLGSNRKAEVEFLKEKYLSEALILNSKVPEKIIIRTGIVFGTGYGSDRFIKSILRLMQYPGFYPIPEAKKLLSPMHIEDIVEILINATEIKLDNTATVCEVCGDESLSVEEIFKLVYGRYGKGSKLPIKGAIGNKLFPLYERDKVDLKTPSISHFLAIGSKAAKDIGSQALSALLLPEKQRSFREALQAKK